MNTLTQHVEQLKPHLLHKCPMGSLRSDPCWCHMCKSARLMITMAKVCEASALVDEYTPGFDQIDARLKLTEARSELDALVKGTH